MTDAANAASYHWLFTAASAVIAASGVSAAMPGTGGDAPAAAVKPRSVETSVPVAPDSVAPESVIPVADALRPILTSSPVAPLVTNSIDDPPSVTVSRFAGLVVKSRLPIAVGAAPYPTEDVAPVVGDVMSNR